LGQQLGRLSASPQQQLAAAPAASAVTQEPSVQQQRGCARARACCACQRCESGGCRGACTPAA